MKFYDIVVDAPDSGSDAMPGEQGAVNGEWRLVFDFYSGQQIVCDSLRYAVTDALKSALEAVSATGAAYRHMVVARGEQFEIMSPHVSLPAFWEMIVTGQSRVDDFSLVPGALETSERALEQIRRIGDVGVREVSSAVRTWKPGDPYPSL